ncbi:hypothetical protein ACX0E4_07015 [Enterococcus faecium]
MQQDKTSNINEKKITLCSLIPGMGQFVNGQAFNRIRQKSPILYRWVMNAVRYEGYRW